ncbi:MAG: MMPL family transporter [Tenericutes bacterium]|jgi:hydrophobe/amphiphile efflux-3 (HAE3) family protein|nr:MMPL family transporter [Mycoplasmatota bacterium]
MNKYKRALVKTYKEMAPAIFVAMIATGLGFLALFTSDVPMIADFGKMLTIGIIVSFIVASLFLLPLLFVKDQHFTKLNNQKNKTIIRSRFLYRFTMKILKFKYFIIVLALGLSITGIILDQKVRVETDVETFMPQDSDALKDIYELRDRMGSTDQIAIIFQSDDILSNENLNIIIDEIAYLNNQYEERIVKINSLFTLAETMDTQVNETSINQLINNLPDAQTKIWITDDHTQMVVQLMIEKMESNDLDNFLDELDEYYQTVETDEISVVITGQAVIDVTMISSLTSGRYTITLLGMLAVFLGLLLIYRRPLKAITPLIPITLIIGWSGLIMYTLDIAYTPLTATLGALIIGIGTEFTILIMDRFYKNENDTMPLSEKISETVNTIGKPILISAITTIGGFSALIISDFEILKNFGIMTVINLVLAVISTLLIMPIVLYIQSSMSLKLKK